MIELAEKTSYASRRRAHGGGWTVLWIAGVLACAQPTPGPGLDAAPADGGLDAARLDVGAVDASAPDVGAPDVGAPDTGVDAPALDSGDCTPEEQCDGADDDCDGRIDEEPTDCAAGERCESGACDAPSWTWETTFGGSTVTVNDVDLDDMGNAYVVGSTDAAVSIGGTALLPGAFLASFDAAGALRWVRGFAGGGLSFSVAVEDGVFVLTETRFGGGPALDFGGGARTGPVGNSACHVAAFDYAGAYVADRQVTSGWLLACRSLAARGDRLAVSRSDAGVDAQLLVLDRTLAEVWRSALPFDVHGWFTAASVASDGSVIAGGYHDDPVDLGFGPLGAMARAAFVVAFDPAGEPRWQRHFDTVESEYVVALELASAGPVVLLGGAGTDPADATVVGLDASGADRFTHPLGGMLFANDLAVAPDGRIGVVGQTIGAIDFGGGSRPASTGFLLALDANGAYRWDVTAARSAHGVSFGAPDRWVVVGGSVDGSAVGYLASIDD